MAKSENSWEDINKFDVGEINPPPGVTRKGYEIGGQSFEQTYRQLRNQFLESEKIIKLGPHLAKVVKVLTGPQLNKESQNNNDNQTKTLNIDGLPDPTKERADEIREKRSIKVIAMVPEISDIFPPEDKNDEARMSSHHEFHQFKYSSEFQLIQEGSYIWVQFHSYEHIYPKSGHSSGYIIGLYDKGAPVITPTLIPTAESFKPPCSALRNLTAPGGGIYKGHTEANPVILPGPPIRKYKNRIVTGLFGNGSLATKANFNRCMQLAPSSFKHNIAGGAPDSNNAFIWVGQLKNNGYHDKVNRPGIGRETIIYAPYSLDTSSPIEIKYYFHDDGGFGSAFQITGDDQEFAIINAEQIDSDFKNKIAPAIKDLIKDSRNFVLVIPELMHSKGASLSRTEFSDSDKAKIKENLKAFKVSENANLDDITPFTHRGLRSFSGTYIGGNFSEFNDEVISVLSDHLGISDSSIQYISILGDGLGAVTIASMVQRTQTRQKFMNLISPSGLQRIDFINNGLDEIGKYGLYFDTTPSAAIYTYLVKPLVDREGQPFEFNYIINKSPTNTNAFINVLENTAEGAAVGAKALFRAANTSPAGIGEQKFTIPVSFSDTVGGPTDVMLSFHIAKNSPLIKAGYAMSVVNKDMNTTRLLRSESGKKLYSSFAKVPDHAEAGAAAQAAADINKIEKKTTELQQQIFFFETLLMQMSLLGVASICEEDSSPYKIYCQQGKINTAKESRFFKDYQAYLENKIEYEEYQIIKDFESQLLESNLFEDRLKAVKDDIEKPSGLKQIADTSLTQTYQLFNNKQPKNYINSLRQNFDINVFGGQFTNDIELVGPDNEAFPKITYLAKLLAAPTAYKKISAKISNTIEKIKSRAVQLSPDCVPPPIKLAEIVPPEPAAQPIAPPVEKTPKCSDKKIVLVDKFEDLIKMINYIPDKKRFTFSNRSSKVVTKINEVEDFKIGTFEYKARGASGQITTKQSFPIWLCITDQIERGWETACNQSSYVPFAVLNGIRGYKDPKTGNEYKGNTAYQRGFSLHSYGLAFDLDPYIAPYTRKSRSPANSVFTGAWDPDFIKEHGETLIKLGVFNMSKEELLKNGLQEDGERRQAQNWKQAPSAYKGAGESGGQRDKYTEIMNKAKNTPIVPVGSNPTKWVVTFCENSNMRWGNANFLKKRYGRGKVWNTEEKKIISEIYDIPDVVDRVQAISWKTVSIDDHMHFHFWGGKSLIPWSQIAKAKKG